MAKKKDSSSFVIPDFRRAGRQRLGAARFLIENEDYRLEAIYLALYAAECALKALLMSRTREDRWKDTVQMFIKDGEKSHHFDYLAAKLAEEHQVFIPIEVAKLVRPLKDRWTTRLRYEAGRLDREEANLFLAAATEISEWVERSLHG